jgi:hypothetical protein
MDPNQHSSADETRGRFEDGSVGPSDTGALLVRWHRSWRRERSYTGEAIAQTGFPAHDIARRIDSSGIHFAVQRHLDAVARSTFSNRNIDQ